MRHAGGGSHRDIRPDATGLHRLHAVQDPDGALRHGRRNRRAGRVDRQRGVLLLHWRRVRRNGRPFYLLIRSVAYPLRVRGWRSNRSRPSLTGGIIRMSGASSLAAVLVAGFGWAALSSRQVAAQSSRWRAGLGGLPGHDGPGALCAVVSGSPELAAIADCRRTRRIEGSVPGEGSCHRFADTFIPHIRGLRPRGLASKNWRVPNEG